MPIQVQPQTVSARELRALPDDGKRYELLKGALHMMSPAGGRHGRLANHFSWLLNNHVQPQQLGEVFAAETGFLISTDPDTVLAPDVAFVSRSRFEDLQDDTGYLPLAPELAVEVLSPNDRFSRVELKAFTWLDAGCSLVLLIAPESQRVHVYRSRQQIQVFEAGEILDCSPAVPGWQIQIADIFPGK